MRTNGLAVRSMAASMTKVPLAKRLHSPPHARGTLSPTGSLPPRLDSTRTLDEERPDIANAVPSMSTLSDLYKSDFHAGTQRAAALVREHKLDEFNLDDLA